MEPSLIAAWIAAGVSLLALLANVVLQLWSFSRTSKHELTMLERQLEFQERSIDRSAENEYMSWLRDKRLIAMERIKEAFDEVTSVSDLWGFEESRDKKAWKIRADAASRECGNATHSLLLVFGIHMDVIESGNDLAKYASRLCSLVLIPWEHREQLQDWEGILEQRKKLREDLSLAYTLLWIAMQSLTTPIPQSEQARLDRTRERPPHSGYGSAEPPHSGSGSAE